MTANGVPTKATANGDLNNTGAAREIVQLEPDLSLLSRTLAISPLEDEAEVRKAYRPFILDDEVASCDWIANLELSTTIKMAEEELKRTDGGRLKVSYSRLIAFEAARILFRLGCDVRIYNPTGLPVKDEVQHSHEKVQELRNLSKWSDGHIWISPEQHGNLIDWIPLSTGSVRPTQGRTLAIAQVSGGSQSFNTVNSLRILGRWMRMFTIPNQSSVPKAYTQFTDETAEEGGSRMIPSDNRDRLVDCMEEFVKYTIVMRPHFDLFGDRFSERQERMVAKAKRQQQELVVATALKFTSTIINGEKSVSGKNINSI